MVQPNDPSDETFVGGAPRTLKEIPAEEVGGARLLVDADFIP